MIREEPGTQRRAIGLRVKHKLMQRVGVKLDLGQRAKY
jgi:hypothetical protein